MIVFDVGAFVVLPMLVLLFTRNNVAAGLTLLFVLVFMYSPERSSINYKPNIFYSPSAGYVKNVTQDSSHVNITLFLNVFDNHTQYFPIESIVLQSKQFSGLFEPAYNEHSINNEKIEHTLQSIKHGFTYYITQITGLLTRRILVMAKKGEAYSPGDRLGFIMLGSRVDIRIPRDNVQKILVHPGLHIQEMAEIIEIKDKDHTDS